MERTIGAFDARRQFGKVLNEVVAHRDCYVVERHGEAIAAVVPIKLYEQWKRSREAFFDRMEASGERVSMPEEEAALLVQTATQAVRHTSASR
jgi:prevent-host-death family protein